MLTSQVANDRQHAVLSWQGTPLIASHDPFHASTAIQVVSTLMSKTAMVAINYYKYIKKYKIWYRRTTKLMVCSHSLG